MVAPVRPRTARMQRRKCSAPPSGRSSRVTEVMTTCRRPSRSQASASRSGSSSGDGLGPSALDRAEAAGAGADVAQDHERRRPPGPALGAIRAAGALADRLQPQLLDQAPREGDPARRRDRPLEPLGKPIAARPSGSAPASPALARVLGRPAVGSSRTGSINMREDLPADLGMVRVEVVPLQPEGLLDLADQRLADLGHRRRTLPARFHRGLPQRRRGRSPARRAGRKLEERADVQRQSVIGDPAITATPTVAIRAVPEKTPGRSGRGRAGEVELVEDARRSVECSRSR